MKNIARIFTFSLIASGAFASVQIAHNHSTPALSAISAMPVPSCPPNDPNACGMAQLGKW